MYTLIEKEDAYLHFQDGDKHILTPSTSSIIIDENVGVKALRATGTRKSIINFVED